MVEIRRRSVPSREAGALPQRNPFRVLPIKSVVALGTLLIAMHSFVSPLSGSSTVLSNRHLLRTPMDRPIEKKVTSTLPLEIADVDSELDYNITRFNDVHQDEGVESNSDVDNSTLQEVVSDVYTDVQSDLEYNNTQFIGDDSVGDLTANDEIQGSYSTQKNSQSNYSVPDNNFSQLQGMTNISEKDGPEGGNLKDLMRDRSLIALELARKDLKTYIPSTKYNHQSYPEPKLESDNISCE